MPFSGSRLNTHENGSYGPLGYRDPVTPQSSAASRRISCARGMCAGTVWKGAGAARASALARISRSKRCSGVSSEDDRVSAPSSSRPPAEARDRAASSRVARTTAAPRAAPDVLGGSARCSCPFPDAPRAVPDPALAVTSYGRAARFMVSAVSESANASNARFASNVTTGASPGPAPSRNASPGGGRATRAVAIRPRPDLEQGENASARKGREKDEVL